MSRRIPLSLLAAAITLATPARGADEEIELGKVVIPVERSASPKLPEWAGATRIRPTRRSEGAAACRVELVREWMQVRCTLPTFALSQLGGDVEGVAFWIDPTRKEGVVLLPIRRGATHVVQFWRAGQDRTGGFAPEPSVMVQQYWLEGAPAPVLTLF